MAVRMTDALLASNARSRCVAPDQSSDRPTAFAPDRAQMSAVSRRPNTREPWRAELPLPQPDRHSEPLAASGRSPVGFGRSHQPYSSGAIDGSAGLRHAIVLRPHLARAGLPAGDEPQAGELLEGELVQMAPASVEVREQLPDRARVRCLTPVAAHSDGQSLRSLLGDVIVCAARIPCLHFRGSEAGCGRPWAARRSPRGSRLRYFASSAGALVARRSCSWRRAFVAATSCGAVGPPPALSTATVALPSSSSARLHSASKSGSAERAASSSRWFRGLPRNFARSSWEPASTTGV